MSVFRHINKVLIREKKWLPMDIDKILQEPMNNSIPWQAIRKISAKEPLSRTTTMPSVEGGDTTGGGLTYLSIFETIPFIKVEIFYIL